MATFSAFACRSRQNLLHFFASSALDFSAVVVSLLDVYASLCKLAKFEFLFLSLSLSPSLSLSLSLTFSPLAHLQDNNRETCAMKSAMKIAMKIAMKSVCVCARVRV